MAADAFIKAHVECRRGSGMPAESLALIRCSAARGIRPTEDRYIELLFKKEKHTRGKENGT